MTFLEYPLLSIQATREELICRSVGLGTSACWGKNPKELGKKGLSPSMPWKTDHKIFESHGKTGYSSHLSLPHSGGFYASLCGDSRHIQTPKYNIRNGSEGAGWVSREDWRGKFKALCCHSSNLNSGFSSMSTFLFLRPLAWKTCGTGEGEWSTFFIHLVLRSYCASYLETLLNA